MGGGLLPKPPPRELHPALGLRHFGLGPNEKSWTRPCFIVSILRKLLTHTCLCHQLHVYTIHVVFAAQALLAILLLTLPQGLKCNFKVVGTLKIHEPL